MTGGGCGGGVREQASADSRELREVRGVNALQLGRDNDSTNLNVGLGVCL